MAGTREPRATVRIASDAVRLIHEECLRHPGLKTGGLLGGYVRHDNRDAHDVLVATRPGPLAAHGECRFVPDVAYGGARLQALRQSDPRLTYVGSWRQDVGTGPRARGIDLVQGQGILADEEYGLESIVLLIASGRPTRLRSFILWKGDAKFREAELDVIPVAAAGRPWDASVGEVTSLRASGQLTETGGYVDEWVSGFRRPQEKTTPCFLLLKGSASSPPEVLSRRQHRWLEGTKEKGTAPVHERILGLCRGAYRQRVTDEGIIHSPITDNAWWKDTPWDLTDLERLLLKRLVEWLWLASKRRQPVICEPPRWPAGPLSIWRAGRQKLARSNASEVRRGRSRGW